MTVSYNKIFLKIYSYFFAKKIGVDDYGNSYFLDKRRSSANNGRERRWIIYQGDVEASKVPPEWNAWLHHVTNEIPRKSRKPKWIKEHLPNQTGTAKSLNSKSSNNKIYTSWRPNDER
mgnify:CR=1 FL=1